MLTDDRPDLFERLNTLGRHLDDEREASASHPGQPARHHSGRHGRLLLMAAAVVMVFGLVAIAELGDDDSPGRPVATAPITTTPTSAAPTASTVPTSTPAAPVETTADLITWQRATDIGSIARSQVSSVVAGPSGFVAIGTGFDDDTNQGRVWYSADGLVWNEPAFDLFDPLEVRDLAVTADAYYVLTFTNTQRVDLTAVPGPPEFRLFRSVDGQTWESWGDPWIFESAGGRIASTGGVLLRSPFPGQLEWSSDGLDWTAATFAEPVDDNDYFEMGGNGVVHGEGTAYIQGFAGGSLAIWSSTDGRQWRQLPEPPLGPTAAPVTGPPIATIDGGLVLVVDPRQQDCLQVANSLQLAEDTDGAARAEWTCSAQPDVYRYDTASDRWSLDPYHLGETPVLPSVTRLGDTLVAPLIEPGKAQTIWTAPVDTLEWTQLTSTRLVFDADAGSPGPAMVAASTRQVVVFSHDRLVDGTTALLVGSLQDS